jgi:hypothetical protein
MSEDYDKGLRNGRTEATLEGIAETVDTILDKVDSHETRLTVLETDKKWVKRAGKFLALPGAAVGAATKYFGLW